MDKASAVIANRHKTIFVGLSLVTVLTCIVFMTYGAQGNWEFIVQFRGRKLAGLILVATAVSTATILFQTITSNRILTPSIMGFDALYRMIQTVLIFFLGAVQLHQLDIHLQFFAEAALMMVFSGLLFRWLFAGTMRDLHLMILAGFVFGALFRSLSDFMQRIINPNDFTILQDRSFARFSTIDETLLGIAALSIVITGALSWQMRHKLDVLALGRDVAISLGLDFKKMVFVVLSMVSILVAVSTALVGPVTFFGLLVTNLAYVLLNSSKHALTLPVAALIAIICLVGGQVILERILEFNTSLSIIIEFVGGMVFIALLLKGNTK